jgi:hypothetical protein
MCHLLLGRLDQRQFWVSRITVIEFEMLVLSQKGQARRCARGMENNDSYVQWFRDIFIAELGLITMAIYVK